MNLLNEERNAFKRGLATELNGHLPAADWEVVLEENGVLSIIGKNKTNDEEYFIRATDNGDQTISIEGNYLPLKAEGNIEITELDNGQGLKMYFHLPTKEAYCYYSVLPAYHGNLNVYRLGG